MVVRISLTGGDYLSIVTRQKGGPYGPYSRGVRSNRCGSYLEGVTVMVMVILHYPALMPTVDALRADKEKALPFFENQIPGLIDKTWGTNDATGRGASVYHFEDRDSADAWFNSDLQRSFREKNHATIEFFEVAAIAFRRPLKERG